MNTKLKAPSAECAAMCEKAVDKKLVNCSLDISPLAMAKSGCRTRPRPPTLPSILTLNGGSVITISALPPPRRRA